VSKTKTTAVVVGLPAVLFATLIGLVLLLAAAALTPAQACEPAGPALVVDGRSLPPGTVAGYGGAQLQNAALVMHAAQARGLDVHAQTLGVMTAMGESSLQVLDRGDPAGPDSRGLFEQRGNGAWGSLADRMNPIVSATNFFTALTAVPGWESLPPTIAAHRVQANADPYYYAPFWDPAVQVVQALGGATVHAPAAAGGSGGGSSTCGVSGVINQAAVTAGGWSNPLPGAVETQPFGVTSYSPNGHPGIDLAMPAGTPLLAVHGGTVVFAGPAQGYGEHYVCIDISGGAVACYGHGQAQLVQVGDQVKAGQPVALEGCEGDCSGPHLHFEIRAGLWGPVQDPAPFMAAHGVKLG
jgi:hypothetical protein